jgi:DNA-binding transcriptional ArsR family regulator
MSSILPVITVTVNTVINLAQLDRSVFVREYLPFVNTYGTAALTALADPTRRAIIEALIEHPRAVGELANVLPVSRPAVSQHLKVLKHSGLVIDRPEGTRRIYRVDPTGIAAMRDYLDEMWDTALHAFAAAVEGNEPEPGKGTDS